MYLRDTIVARATPPGRGAVAIVRISGDRATAILDRMFTPSKARGGDASAESWRFRHGTLRDDRNGHVLDEVLVVTMPGPSTYTGEDVVEIHCHGSPLICDRIISATLAHGARPAERGEFTRRAYLNGRVDLVQAEAVADLIEARMERGALVAWDQLQGALSERLETARQRIIDLLAELEASVDFSDEELPAERPELRIAALAEVESEIRAMLDGFAVARRWREGYRTVFCGRPNVGKSSLVNALLGSSRMIVTDEPGTTRDSVEELIELDGTAFVLTDTAGMRDAPGRAEEEAVERARVAADDADILVLVLDGSGPMSAEEREWVHEAESRCAFIAINKNDLPAGLSEEDLGLLRSSGRPLLKLSAINGSGISELGAQLKECVRAELAESSQQVGVSSARHRAALERCLAAVARARQLQLESGPPELTSLELRAAATELAAITHPLDNEEILDEVFRTFCIGK